MQKNILKLAFNARQYDLRSAVTSKHIRKDRKERIEALQKASKAHKKHPFKIIGSFYEEDPLRSFHNGYNSDCIVLISETGTIYKYSTGRNPKLITFYFSSVNKIKGYFNSIGEEAPAELIEVALLNEKLGLHKI